MNYWGNMGVKPLRSARTIRPSAPINLARGGAEAPAADTEPLISLTLFHRFAVRLSKKGAVLHDLAELGGPVLHPGEVDRCPRLLSPSAPAIARA
jgi:hypothetical protein